MRTLGFRLSIFMAALLSGHANLSAQQQRVFAAGKLPADSRLQPLKNLNGYFPFQPVSDVSQWEKRQAEIRRRILVSQGLWPEPTKSPLHAVVHGRVERKDYVVDRVFFESIPGHYVTGSLYRPKNKSGPLPAILSPHGHWNKGRFHDAGEAQVKTQIKDGAEQFPISGRHPIQARAVQLARMGCIVFVYDMTGYADSRQVAHRPDKWSHLDRDKDWGFMSVQAELRLQNMMGLQTWNSIRAIDFLSELEDVDTSRLGVTGASGGGTQSMIIAAIDPRIAAAMPCVMVSTAMQGGCSCENASLLRIDQGNIDIAAAVAPRPLGLTAADDWTVELETKGYPDLLGLYEMLGKKDHLTAVFHTRFKHNYNQVNRAAMYQFFNRHFDLGLKEPIAERDFQPLTQQEASVWTDQYPAPTGDRVGDAHQIRILHLAARDSDQHLLRLVPQGEAQLARFKEVVGGAWETILGRNIGDVGDVTFQETSRKSFDTHTQVLGRVDHAGAAEQLPSLKLLPKSTAPKGTVIWITDYGKEELLSNPSFYQAALKLLDQGYAVLTADLFGQGEFLADGDKEDQQPMWFQRGAPVGWHRFAGYTYGYNHPVFVKRVHDVLSLVKLASSQTPSVHLIGLGRSAGPLAAAARTRVDQQVDQTFIDVDGFRFDQLARHDDPGFVPGSVKYFGVDGLFACCLPAPLTIVDSRGDTTAAGQSVAGQTYASAGLKESIRWVSDRQQLLSGLIESLSQ
ncbi:MAG: acetylxylan esterase [Pirellulales bacterium]|nr:acetylxylan esterase [Pirellulales bacterium]